MAARKLLSFNGNNGVGPATVTGLKAGDQVLNLIIDSTALSNIPGTSAEALFSTIAVSDDELLQIAASDLSSLLFCVLIEREVLLV